MAYLTLTEARSLTKLPKPKVPDDKLELLVEASTIIIDEYVLKPYETTNALIKLVSTELILYLSKDRTYQSEQVDDYSYKLNEKALATILAKLDKDRIKNGGAPMNYGISKVRGGYL
jgi:hypothetical protein